MLAPGDPAPDFEAPDQGGTMRRLADMRGRYLVLYFYPKDGTWSCTREACGFRDHREDLTAAGLTVWGVSRDSARSHQAFVDRHALPFTLLSDRTGRVVDAYGASTWNGLPRRVTYLIGPDGRIVRAYRHVWAGSHASRILKDFNDSDRESHTKV